MDGLPQTFQVDDVVINAVSRPEAIGPIAGMQRTLRAPIHCRGVGLHSGRTVTLVLRPAPVNHGIVVRRSDLGIDIPARYDHVIDTRLCTVLGLPGHPEVRVGTVEHALAALAGCGIHNAILEVDGPEMPILDGSAADFVFLIDCAGTMVQEDTAPVIEVLRPVRVSQGDSFVELRPLAGGFDLAVSIAFAAPAIGRQALTLRHGNGSFRHELAAARTFTLAEEVAALHQAGLARGGSLRNAVVVQHDRVLNPEGLRMADEFVRHKMLDLVGDLALAGAALRARCVAHRPGHTLNNQVLRALFADRGAWRLAPVTEPALGWQTRLPVAAAPV